MTVERLPDRRCPGCSRTVKLGEFACRECWHSLPPTSRRAINAAWRALGEAQFERPDELAAAFARYNRVAEGGRLMLASRLGL